MKTKIFKNVNVLFLIVIILTFVFIYFSYYLIYIPKKETQLQQNGFRILKEYGSNMLDKQKYFENHFKNYGIYYAIKFSGESINEDVTKFIEGLPAYVITDSVTNNCDSIYFQKDKAKKLLLSFRKKNAETELIDSIIKSEINKKTRTKWIFKTGFSNSVPIDKFMEGLKFEQLFENIVLFNYNNVYYNSRQDNIVDLTNTQAMCDSTKKMQGGIYKKLNISGENKHILTLPIDFFGEKYFISGFISDIDYRNKTRTINKQFLIFIVGILLLLFAGIPIIKIVFIDPQERLKASDATYSIISLLFGIGLFIIIIIGFSKKLLIDKSALENRIESISDRLVKNVMYDLNSIKELGSILAIKNKKDQLTDTIISKLETGKSFRDTNLCYPFPLNEILLIKQNGIVINAYRSTPFSDIVKTNLSERKYFKNIIEIDKSWPHKDIDNLNFYIESIKSLNTGAVETAISFNTSKFGDSKVLAITSAIPSLYKQVLPKDIECVIIDNTGKVLYHSIQDKILHENFAEECENNTSLINAMSNRDSVNLSLNYGENKWLARIVPIENTPLYHITLLDLSQTGNKNARIFLFTIYFMFISLLLAGIIIFLICTTLRLGAGSQKNTWYFNWLVLDRTKYHLYKLLTYILTLLTVIQMIGVIFIKNPIPLLFYQTILICSSFFVSFLFLVKREKNFKEFIVQKNIRLTLFVFIVFMIILIIYLINFSSIWYFIILLLVLLLIFVSSLFFYDYFSSLQFEKINSLRLSEFKLNRTYLVFLFLLFTNMSAIPVVQYYLSVKHQEELLWKKDQLFNVAKENIALLTDAKLKNHHDKDWFNRIQGNGIDFYDVSESDQIKNSSNVSLCIADRIYASIPDPVTNWYNQPRLSTETYINTSFSKESLTYHKGLQKGTVFIKQNKDKYFPSFQNSVVIILILSLIVVCIIIVIQYLASIILNLKPEKFKKQENTWFEILKNKKYHRVLLHSFDGDCFLSESIKFIEKNVSKKNTITNIKASQIVSPNFKTKSLINGSKIIWISELKQILFELEKHEIFLSVLNKLNQKCKNRIIVEMAFDPGEIKEFYDDYIHPNILTDNESAKINTLQKRWKNLFNEYFVFNGYLNLEINNASKIITFEDSFRNNCKTVVNNSRFPEIWSNLTSFEKIFLYDLAEDGLVNSKNKNMMRKLVSKRLINREPYPVLFSDDFKTFVRNNINSSERKEIESKLGIKHSGQNAKYLFLLILVPLSIFILISQGLSIEKIVGIFAGGLTVIGGLMRLFDSNSLKQGAS